MKNNIYLTILVFTSAVYTSFSQQIIDIELDSIFCYKSKCNLLNFSEELIINCEIYAAPQSIDRVNYVLDCSFDEKLITLNGKTNELRLKKIYKLDYLEKWVANLNFARKSKNAENKMSYFYKSVDAHYGFMNIKRFSKDSKSWEIIDKEVFQIIPIRINHEYFIAGVKNLDNKEIELLIIPTEDNLGIMYDYDGIIPPSKHEENIDSIFYQKVFNSFLVRNINDKKFLTNSTSSTPIINQEFEEIIIEYPYVIAKTKSSYFIYDKKLRDITPDNLIFAYPHYQSIQIIVDNKVQWIDNKGNISDTMPIFRYSICTSGSPCFQKRIINNNGNFYEIINDCTFFSPELKEKFDTFKFNLNKEISEIKFINNNTMLRDEIYGLYTFFRHNANLYYFKTTDGNEGVFQHINEKSEQLNKIISQQDLNYYDKKKLIQNATDSIITTFRDEIIFEDKFSEFILDSYYQPIIYKKNNLYGFFPTIEEPKYIAISKFYGYLAEVTFKDGSKGWVDIYGNEYKKE